MYTDVNVSYWGAVLPGRKDAEMGAANSLHVSAYYNEYTELLFLIWWWKITGNCKYSKYPTCWIFQRLEQRRVPAKHA